MNAQVIKGKVMKWKLTAMLVLSASCLCNCSTTEILASGDAGRIKIEGDAQGILAWSQMQASQAQIAKDSPNVRGSAWQSLDKQTESKVMIYQLKYKEAE
jgi:hypothetical protein